jgi:ribosome-associated protein
MAFSEKFGMGPNVDGKGRRVVPEHEMAFEYSRSGGSGGQKVNKTSSKAILKWHVGKSGVFTPKEKELIRKNVEITVADEIVLHCDEERSQGQNKAACIERLHAKLHDAIQVQAERVATKKPRGVKRREEDSNRLNKLRKSGRGKVDYGE